jgi:hypothetical protein
MHFPLRALVFFIGTWTPERKWNGRGGVTNGVANEAKALLCSVMNSFVFSSPQNFSTYTHTYVLVIPHHISISSFCANCKDTMKWRIISLLSGLYLTQILPICYLATCNYIVTLPRAFLRQKSYNTMISNPTDRFRIQRSSVSSLPIYTHHCVRKKTTLWNVKPQK